MSNEQSDKVTNIEEAQALRRKDLIELGRTFTSSLAPVAALVGYQETAVEEMRKLSRAAEHQARATRHQTYAIWAVILLAAVVLGVLYGVAKKVDRQSRKTADIHHRVLATVGVLQRLTESAMETRESVEAAEVRAAAQPTVQLVPEMDPEKAKTSPMKILIEAPLTPPPPPPPPLEDVSTGAPPNRSAGSARKSSAAPAKGATVEIPISASAL